MNYKILLVAVIFLTPILNIRLNAQLNLMHFSEKLTYNLKYTKDSVHPEMKNFNHIVLIGDSVSLSGGEGNINWDTIIFIKTIRKDKSPNKEANPRDFGNNFRIFKTKDSIITYAPLFTLLAPPVRYKEAKTNFQWKTLPDTMTIGDWSCKKAELQFGGRNWVAWYCPDISSKEGPYKFSGLPGLIVKIYDDKDFWDFTLTKIESCSYNYPVGAIYDGGIWTDKIEDIEKKDFFKLYKASQINAFEIQNRYINIDYFGKEEQEKIHLMKAAAKDNNWIEMKP